MLPSEWPTSIRGINSLPDEQKQAIYRTLLPDDLLKQYGIDLENPGDYQPIVTFHTPPKSRAMELIVKRDARDLDRLFYLNMADTFNNQLLVLLVVVNDLDAPRFNIDVDLHGNRTHFGTVARNLAAERAAMEAGLSPGQVRRGLRAFRQFVPVFEQFVTNMQHDLFFIEPLMYANAIVFERYGFNYLRGRQEMLRIDTEFHPGGELHAKLTPDNPFRQPDAWETVRGRAWAIHDGILGHPFTGFQMYKRVGKHAEVNTFPVADW